MFVSTAYCYYYTVCYVNLHNLLMAVYGWLWLFLYVLINIFLQKSCYLEIFFWWKFFVLNNRSIFFRSLPATHSTNYVIAIIIGLVCVVTLLLPTQQEVPHPSNIPAYLHVSVNFKLVLAYVLGLVSMVIFKPWTKDVAYVLSWQFLYVKFGDK